MRTTREEHLVGLASVEAATTLLRRVRSAHPTKGLFETGDVQWRWRTERSTDSFPQLFWFDELGRPEAAALVTDWSGTIALDPLVLPDASAEWVAHVIQRGLEHAGESGFETVELEVDRADAVTAGGADRPWLRDQGGRRRGDLALRRRTTSDQPVAPTDIDWQIVSPRRRVRTT